MQVIQTQPVTPTGRFQYGGGPQIRWRGAMEGHATRVEGPMVLSEAVARKTVDYNTSVVEYLENRVWQRDYRDARALQPDSGYYTRLMPPLAMLANPINAVTTKFVRTSTNKMRCPIFCVVWTPEGRRLITGASSGEFTLWNGLTFNFETILQAHDSSVRCMVWSHNDTWMVTGDHSGYVKYWQSNMNNVKMFQGHKEAIRGISFCPTDTKFTTCSDDGTVRVWDFLRCFEEKILRGHGADVKCVDWHPQKSLIVSGSKDSQQPIKLWDPKSGQSLATIHAHKSTVMEEACSLAWHPIHECLFASGGSDGAIMFWMVGADKEVGAMENAHDSCVWSLAWHPLGHILCSGSNDHTSKFWTRNRPGDKMRDKYNLNTLPRGLDDSGEYDEPTTTPASITPNIPGMGLEQATLEAVRALSDVQASVAPMSGGGGSRKEFGRELIPGLDLGPEETHSESHSGGGGRHKRTPFSKPIPKHFQQQWMENKQPLLLAPPEGSSQKQDGADDSQPPATMPGMTAQSGMNLQQQQQQQGIPMMGQPPGFAPVGGLLNPPQPPTNMMFPPHTSRARHQSWQEVSMHRPMEYHPWAFDTRACHRRLARTRANSKATAVAATAVLARQPTQAWGQQSLVPRGRWSTRAATAGGTEAAVGEPTKGDLRGSHLAKEGEDGVPGADSGAALAEEAFAVEGGFRGGRGGPRGGARGH
ncbi:hypothetical protein MRX96_002172 [Rhipicephalus microplus]